MSNVLLLLTSPRGDASLSTKVASDLAARLAKGGTLVSRDYGKSPLPHIDEDLVTATRSGKSDFSAAERAGADRANAVIADVQAADVVVIGASMINFGPSTALKGWFDHLAVPGATFRYGANGAEGLIKGKKVIVVQASAGMYGDGGASANDYLSPWLTFVLGFVGITDVEFIRVEGVAYGPEQVEKTLAAAAGRVAAIAA